MENPSPVEYLDAAGTQPHDQFASRVPGAREIAVAPLEDDDAVLVGLHALVGGDVHGSVRQREQRGPVAFEQVGLPVALAVVGLVRHAHAPFEQIRVKPVQRPGLGDRHEQRTPDRADLGLHLALLVAGVRFEPVVGAETAGQLRVSGPSGPVEPSHAGRVVEHDTAGHPAKAFEQVPERLARAFRVLPGGQARHRGVRVREQEHEEVHARAHAPPVHVGLAEVRLGLRLVP